MGASAQHSQGESEENGKPDEQSRNRESRSPPARITSGLPGKPSAQVSKALRYVEYKLRDIQHQEDSHDH